MKKIIPGWEHLPGIHCGSVSIRDVVNFYGIQLSEPMCFGLGAGLGFFYIVDENMSPSRNIHVRGPEMEPNFFSLFMDDFFWKFDDDNENALDTLLSFLSRGIPVILQTDIYYLKYYNSGTHFPGHVVVACGFDDMSKSVFLSDTGYGELQQVSYDELASSRCSKAVPYPLRNNWLAVERLSGNNLKRLIPGAVMKNAQNMLDGVSSLRGNSGVENIRILSSDLPEWINATDWKWSARYSYQVIQKRGTCGAGFRWMYRDFLKESESTTGNGYFGHLAADMDRIGSSWFEISNKFKIISEMKSPDSSLKELAVLTYNLYQMEKDFYIDVIEILNREDHEVTAF